MSATSLITEGYGPGASIGFVVRAGLGLYSPTPTLGGARIITEGFGTPGNIAYFVRGGLDKDYPTPTTGGACLLTEGYAFGTVYNVTIQGLGLTGGLPVSVNITGQAMGLAQGILGGAAAPKGQNPPASQPPDASFRTINWGSMVETAWGSEYNAPDHGVYQFSNGRGFDSTDKTDNGIYNGGADE
jgi:hypothetical protein